MSTTQQSTKLSNTDRAALREQQSEYTLATLAAQQTMALGFSLPYLQGFILFVLATLFPFFVIASCLMRQGSGIIFWAGAWVWVKSWDVGWAMIMMVDQLLWELMPHTAIYIPVARGVHSPITVLESAFDTDPTYTLATYYTLIGMLLLAIPTITGQVFLRGAQGISQILLGNVQQQANARARIENNKDRYRLEEHKKLQGLVESEDPDAKLKQSLLSGPKPATTPSSSAAAPLARGASEVRPDG